MATKFSHVHRLRKHKYKSGNSVYFCTLIDCHYKIDVPLSIGKRTLCNICENEFIITDYTIRLDKPHCGDCGKVKVIDSNGKTRYVRKVTNKILTGVAIETRQNLRDRLDGMTGAEAEEDI